MCFKYLKPFIFFLLESYQMSLRGIFKKEIRGLKITLINSRTFKILSKTN